MKNRLWATLFFALLIGTSFAQTARVQIIHNSPTPTVDIYANDDLLLNDFAFRTATPYIDVPAGVNIDIGVAGKKSGSADDAIAVFPVNFEAGKTYIVVATGIVGGSPGFDLAVTDMGKETTDVDDNVGLFFYHGSPDAPTVDIVAGGAPVFDDISYGEFGNYLEVQAASYELGVTPGADNSNIIANYEADFGFWKDRTAVVFASGFLSGEKPAFEPWVALSTGGTFPLKAIPLPPAPGARAQIVHNAGEAPVVDIYINDDLLLDDFSYRTATPFVDVPTNTTLTVGVAPPTSTSASDAIATFDVMFEDGEKYIIVAEGLLSGNPGFTLNVYDEAQEEAEEDDEFDLLIHHGSPDAPAVDVVARGVGTLAGDISFGEFEGYLDVDPTSYNIDLKPAGTNDVVAAYVADLTGLEGVAAMVFASGGLATTEHDFGLFAVLPDGTVIRLPEAELARLQVIHNSPGVNVDVYVNGSLLLEKFVFRTATPYIDVPSGVLLDIAVAPSGSNSADDAVANFPVTLENGATYVAIANGIVGGNPGFNLELFDMGLETVDDDNVGILFFHGSPDAPTVDVLTGGNILIDDASYTDFAGYLEVPAGSYDLAITPGNDNSTIVAEYEANLGFLKGKTAVIFASGFLSGADPAFEPWVAMAKGSTFPLKPVDDLISDPVQQRSQISGLAPNPASDYFNFSIDVFNEEAVEIQLINISGQIVQNKSLGTMFPGKHSFEMDVTTIEPGMYYLQTISSGQVNSQIISIVK